MVQWLAHPTSNQGDAGSIATPGNMFFIQMDQLVVRCRYLYTQIIHIIYICIYVYHSLKHSLKPALMSWRVASVNCFWVCAPETTKELLILKLNICKYKQSSRFSCKWHLNNNICESKI